MTPRKTINIVANTGHIEDVKVKIERRQRIHTNVVNGYIYIIVPALGTEERSKISSCVVHAVREHTDKPVREVLSKLEYHQAMTLDSLTPRRVLHGNALRSDCRITYDELCSSTVTSCIDFVMSVDIVDDDIAVDVLYELVGMRIRNGVICVH